jgi:hypothetical protein
VSYFAASEFHDAHGKRGSALVVDCVFRDPDLTAAEDPPDVEARGLSRMMATQGLEIGSAMDALA